MTGVGLVFLSHVASAQTVELEVDASVQSAIALEPSLEAVDVDRVEDAVRAALVADPIGVLTENAREELTWKVVRESFAAEVQPVGEGATAPMTEAAGPSMRVPADPKDRTQLQTEWFEERQVRTDEQVAVRLERGAGLVGAIEEAVSSPFAPKPPILSVLEAEPLPDIEDAVDPFATVVAVGSPGAWHCTGTLIAARLVLTAAHCLPAVQVRVPDARSGGSFANVVGASRHPRADVAVVWLDRDVARVPAIWRLAGDDVPPNDTLTAIGFGPRSEGGHGEGRKELEISANGWGCSPGTSAILGCRPEWEMTLSGFGAPDTCRGDSGGPLFESIGSGFRMVAVTSRALASASVSCGDGGVYTRLDRVDPWLRAQLSVSVSSSRGVR